MKKTITIFILTIFFISGNSVFCQSGNDSLLFSLKKELFPFQEDTTLMSISSLCENAEIDRAYNIYARQPDIKPISDILRRLIFTKDVSLIPKLEEIREDYSQYFKKDWEPIVKLHIVNCEAVVEKIQILQHIEEALLSLNFAKMDLREQDAFSYYVEVQKRWYKYINDVEKGYFAFNKFNGYSRYYTDLMEQRIAGLPLFNFDFIEPYLEDLAEPLLSYLKNYYIDGLKVQKLELEGYVFFKILNIANERENPLLLGKLIDLLLTNKNIYKIEVSRNAIVILKNSMPNGLLERRIIEQLKTPKGYDKMSAMLASSYVFRADFVDTLIELSKADVFLNEEKAYMKTVFEVLMQRPYITQDQKEVLSRYIKE